MQRNGRTDVCNGEADYMLWLIGSFLYVVFVLGSATWR